MLSIFKRQIKKAFRPSWSITTDVLALELLRPLGISYLPWTAAAIRPASLCTLLNEVIINERRSLVEFGSGISTLYLARILRETGGTLTSFEHDEDWIKVVGHQLIKNDLLENVKLIHAPLAASDDALDGCRWYDVDIVRARLHGCQLDGIIVDGPPASSIGLELARYPAVPVLAPYLSESFFVYLDDLSRQGEQTIFNKWESLLHLRGSTETVAGDYGILRKGGRFATSVYEFYMD